MLVGHRDESERRKEVQYKPGDAKNDPPARWRTAADQQDDEQGEHRPGNKGRERIQPRLPTRIDGHQIGGKYGLPGIEAQGKPRVSDSLERGSGGQPPKRHRVVNLQVKGEQPQSP